MFLNEKEMFIDIEGYEGHYSVSNMGRVYSHKRKGRFLKSAKNKNGYLIIILCKDGIKKNNYIHVLVGNAFVGKRENGLTFDHIDRNKLNNCADNIRLATKSEQSINKNLQKNNKLGEKNITIDKYRYQIQIKRNNKIVCCKSLAIKDFTLEQVVELRNRFLDNYN